MCFASFSENYSSQKRAKEGREQIETSKIVSFSVRIINPTIVVVSVSVGVCACNTWMDVCTCASGSQMSRLGISSGLASTFNLDWVSH